jgi:acetyltransferase-like isoleucine patch superfamily enzyme
MAERPEPVDLAAALRALYEEVDEGLRARWARSLPLQDGLIDRWDRATRLGFGAEASIYNSAVVLEPVAVGPSSWIGPNTLLDGSGGGITIGAFCSISAGVHVYTHDTVLWSVSLGAGERTVGPVAIGDGCHIGAQSVIAPGVTIGDRCVVGANSFVNRSVPERTIVVGSPARAVGHVEGEGSTARLVMDPPAVEG